MPSVVISICLDPIDIPDSLPMDDLKSALADIQAGAEARLSDTRDVVFADLSNTGLSKEGNKALADSILEMVSDATNDPLCEKAYSIRTENPGLSAAQFDALTDNIHNIVNDVLGMAQKACNDAPDTELPPKYRVTVPAASSEGDGDGDVEYNVNYLAYTLLSSSHSKASFVPQHLRSAVFHALDEGGVFSNMTLAEACAAVGKMTERQFLLAVDTIVKAMHKLANEVNPTRGEIK